VPKLGILPGTGAQIKNQNLELELKLKIRSRKQRSVYNLGPELEIWPFER